MVGTGNKRNHLSFADTSCHKKRKLGLGIKVFRLKINAELDMFFLRQNRGFDKTLTPY